MATEIVEVNLPTLSVTNSASNYLFDTTAPIGVAPAATYTNYGHGQVAMASLSVGPLHKQYPNLLAFMLQVRCTDQNVTAYYATLLDGATAWTIWNNGGSGDTVIAGTPFEQTYDVWGNDARIYLTNGGTGPTVLQASLRLVFGDRGGA